MGRLQASPDGDPERLTPVTLPGAYRVRAACLPHLRRGCSPGVNRSVVNVASASGVRPTLGEAPYSAAKAGLISLTQSAAMEAAPAVRVNCVSPGFVAPPLTQILPEQPGVADALAASTPLGRVGTAHEVAGVIAVLLSDAAG